MKFEQSNRSAMLLPVPPEPRERPYRHPLEIADQAKRDAARSALLMLWDAMDLSLGRSGVKTLESMRRESHRRAFEFIGEMALGSDFPTKEELT